jgi:uncharacterized damage-inducible protein DinB
MQISAIRTMFDYLYWLRDRVLDAVSELPPEAFITTEAVGARDLRATLVHELDVEASWRARLRWDVPAQPETELNADAYPTLETLREQWRADQVAMGEWLATLTDRDLLLAPPREETDAFPLWHYLVHVVTHGIQELTEAAVLLHASGRAPTNLGFLDFGDTLTGPGPGADRA